MGHIEVPAYDHPLSGSQCAEIRTEIVLPFHPASNRRNAGFTDEERGKFTDLLASGFTDTWRFLNPDEVKYSWWSYRFQAREKNVGWRIDYFLVSDLLKDKVAGAGIHNEVFGSDHCPVTLLLDV